MASPKTVRDSTHTTRKPGTVTPANITKEAKKTPRLGGHPYAKTGKGAC